ncbi:MAG TPA: hydantoinase/oxoprolinase family protein [bacterium]|nr:hydantoinase/oxoprolinase family protein [bacterium]
MALAAPYRIGLDIGGTFTDLVLMHDPTGRLWGHKILTTPADPAEAALRGLREICGRAGIGLSEVGTVIHATTLVTNAIIERTGARTALLATEGFRDVLEIGREQRYDIYDLFLRYPDPLVPRRWRAEVRERITRDGEVFTPIDPAAVRARVSELAAMGIEAIAVSFLHAYKNPVHERLVRDLIEREFPHLAVSISSEVAPEIREYERTSTTVCNAYVQPLLARYVRRLEEALGLEGFAGRFLLTLSSGTLTTPDVACRFPVRLLESGPAAGALVAGHLGATAGHAAVVGFDMGGTTAKVCLVENGRPAIAPRLEVARVHRFRKGSGLPVIAPVVDMIELGAGGGSLARVDALGLLRVGPQSAGADPGPASYGFGGTEATVTDACVVLGYFDPGAFLGGTMPLDSEAARAALARAGAPLGLDTVETAWGIFAIVCESMAQAARLYLIERGQDPRRFAVMGFGGAGPATAARLARLLGAREVLIPPASGLASALGLLVAPPGFDFVRSLAGDLEELDWDAVERLYTEMETQGDTMLAGAGASAGEIRRERRAELRYAGQFHDIEVPVPSPLGQDAGAVLRQRFDAAYAALYGVSLPGYPVQALNWRVLVSAPAPAVKPWAVEEMRSRSVTGKGRRKAYMPDAGGFVEVPVYDRYRLPADAVVLGPAIVEEAEATTVLWSGDRLTVDAGRNLVIRVDVAGAVPERPATGVPR